MRPARLIQKAGQEYGTVTGRPRRCGWFDAELVRFTAQMNGVTELALTKLDVLDEPGDDQDLRRLPPCADRRPAMRIIGSWMPIAWKNASRCISRCRAGSSLPAAVRSFADLPPQAQAYVRKVEELVEAPVRYVSVGPRARSHDPDRVVTFVKAPRRSGRNRRPPVTGYLAPFWERICAASCAGALRRIAQVAAGVHQAREFAIRADNASSSASCAISSRQRVGLPSLDRLPGCMACWRRRSCIAWRSAPALTSAISTRSMAANGP